MVDLLDTGFTFLANSRRASMARNVTYKRGADSVVLLATPGNSTWDSTDDAGTVIESRVKDFLINTEDLVLNSILVEPEKGDLIEVVLGGKTITHEVSPPGPAGSNEPAWRYSNQYRKTIRIHTLVTGEI